MPDSDVATNDLRMVLDAGPEFQRGLIALAAPYSLTDNLADHLLAIADAPSVILDILHASDLIVDRGMEWVLADRIRPLLLKILSSSPDLHISLSRALIEMASKTGPERESSLRLPEYLTDGTGLAYHSVLLDRKSGLDAYGRLLITGNRRSQWVAASLAREQQELGLLPENSPEVAILQGVVRVREELDGLLDAPSPHGLLEDREAFSLRPSEGTSRAASVLGRPGLVSALSRPEPARMQLEAIYRCAALTGTLGEQERWKSEVLTSLAIWSESGDDRDMLAEAYLFSILGRSRELGLERHGQASVHVGRGEVLAVLGEVVARDRRRQKESERLLRQSVAAEKRSGDTLGQSLVMRTLARVVARDRKRLREAEGILRRGLNATKASSSSLSRAIMMLSLGDLVAQRPSREAEARTILEMAWASVVADRSLPGRIFLLDLREGEAPTPLVGPAVTAPAGGGGGGKGLPELFPDIHLGDRLKVYLKIGEGASPDIKVVPGIVVSRSGKESFTIGTTSPGVGLLRSFPLQSKEIYRIEVVTRGDSRQAKLQQLRAGRRAKYPHIADPRHER